MALAHPSLVGLDPTAIAEPREHSELQSRVDQAYRLAWLAGDDITRERLQRYAMELERSMTPS